MKNSAPELLDTVTNTQSIPASRLSLVEPAYKEMSELPAGQIGTVVELYKGENVDKTQYLIEFADSQGCEYAMAVLKPEEILTIRYELPIAG